MSIIIALLICLGLERFWDGVSDLRYFGWFDMYKDLFNKHLGDKPFWKGYVKIAGLVVPLLLVVLIFYLIFSGMLDEIGASIIAVLVLTYCLGPGNLYGQMQKCVIKGEDGKTTLAAEQMIAFFGLDAAGDDHAARLSLSETFLVVANPRLFAVCFWFALFGIIGMAPVGAMLYRLVTLCEADDSMKAQATLIQTALDWPAARILAFMYAITGNFMGVFPAMMKHLFDGLEKNAEILKASARAAFGIAEDKAEKDQEIDPLQAMHLLDRALGVGMVIVFIFILIF